MRATLALAALLLAVACRGGEEPNAAVTAEQIEQLSTPQPKEAPDLQASVRLEPLGAADLAAEGLSGAGCRFHIGEALLLATSGSDAVVRVGGEVRHLVHSAPVGANGGFFEDRHFSVSVGRAQGEGEAGGPAAGSSARLTATNRRTEAQAEFAGTWSCG